MIDSKSVTAIDYKAFEKNKNIQTLTIPENIESISFNAFSECTSLETVNFNAIKCDGAVSPIFDGCINLKTINVGPKVTKIGSYMFAEVPVTGINIPSSVKEIDYKAFLGSGLKEVTIPESVESISFNAFSNSTSLETVNFNAIKCDGAVSPIFDGCISLKTINVGPKVTKIGSYMFAGVPVTGINIPSSVKEIDYKAFLGTALKTISLPEALTDISFDVFKDCNELTDVYYAGAKETWAKIKIGSGNDILTKANIHYGKVLTIVPTTKVTAPAKAKITKVNTKKKSAKKIKLTLKKISNAKGYQVAVYTSSKNAKNDKKAILKKIVKKTSATLSSKKLKNKKTLYVTARAYALNGKIKVYGKWSTVKKVKIKK